MYIGMVLNEKPEISIAGIEGYFLKLPEGCSGILFAFKTKKAARKWCGKKVKLLQIELEEK